jgi:SsrA-binding protein
MKVVNRKARYNYELLDKFEVGVVLSGAEVKSVKEGKISLDDAFARINDEGEVWLYNAHIHPYQFADNRDYKPTRPRKLLLHKKEIISLKSKVEAKRLVLVPTACYLRGRTIKMELALGKGKKTWDKREAIKRRDLEREAERELRIKD